MPDRPLVFFNTCHSGRLGFDLTKPQGWAQHMVDELGVAAFVGSHWAISDELAACFSQTFYDTLRKHKTWAKRFTAPVSPSATDNRPTQPGSLTPCTATPTAGSNWENDW
ncbi:MAG: hypothetical protein R2873_16005 [Caldilineaceae bacterium]